MGNKTTGEINVREQNRDANLDNEYREELPDVFGAISRNARNKCGWNILLNRLPIIKWLPKYQLKYLFEDFVAGLTVGLTVIPQGIAYAIVAGLKPQYGLYSAFMGCFVYIFFGTCKDITVGPTAIMSLMVQHYVSDSSDFAILSCFLSGCIITLFGILNLGFLVQYISSPVTVGFTTAAAITIASGQINSIFGIPSKTNDFLPAWENFFTKFGTLNIWDAILGVTTLICLLLLRQLKDVQGPFKCFAKYLSLSRNALAVIIGTLIAYLLYINDIFVFKLTGNVELGLPPFELPPFSTIVNNGTVLEFPEMLSTLGSSIITIPMVSILESIAIAKAFSKGKTVDASQEMLALGICNFFGSFVSSMPITGSFTRTAVNNASGVRTTFGGFFTGCIVLLALAFLTHMFFYIPKATLSAIIIAAMFFMIDYKKIMEIWRVKKIDTIPLLVTILTSLFVGLEYGILAGIAINLTFILYSSSRPRLELSQDKIDGRKVLFVNLNQSLVYSAAEYIKYKILKEIIASDNEIKCVVLNGSNVNSIDSTVALNLNSLCDDLKVLNCDIIFWNWKKQAATVLLRLNNDLRAYFKDTITINDIFVKDDREPSTTITDIVTD